MASDLPMNRYYVRRFYGNGVISAPHVKLPTYNESNNVLLGSRSVNLKHCAKDNCKGVEGLPVSMLNDAMTLLKHACLAISYVVSYPCDEVNI